LLIWLPTFPLAKCPNGSCEPILNSCILRVYQWYKKLFDPIGLAPAITLWRFESPSELQLPRWELTWECGGSFPHTLPHSQEHELWLPGFTLGLHLHKPLPGCERFNIEWIYIMQLELNLIQFNLILIQTPKLNSNTLNEINIQFNSIKFKLNWLEFKFLNWSDLNWTQYSFFWIQHG